MPATLTVLICTHERPALLARALTSLNRAARPAAWHVELLVIANACTDGTVDLLRRYQRDAATEGLLPLQFAEEPRAGKSLALNLAMGLLRTDAVAFVDDDHRVDEGYLAAVCEALETYAEADLLCGRIIPDWDGSEPSWVHDDGRYRIYPLPIPRYDLGDAPLSSPEETATPGGGNWVVRRDLLGRVGPFSSAYGPVGHDLSGSEDKEWAKRALASNARFQYVPAIVQYHHVDPARLRTTYLLRKAFERSASAIRLAEDVGSTWLLPGYLWRKGATYLALALATVRGNKRRFYLVRLAAVLGEIKGHLQARADRRSGPEHSIS